MEALRQLYIYTYGVSPQSVERLPGAGSNRQYYRIVSHEGNTMIGVVGTSAEENHAFCEIARYMHGQHLPVPELYAVSADCMRYLQEDLGSDSLFDFLKSGRESGGQYNDEQEALLHVVMSDLPRLQYEGGSQKLFRHCYPQEQMDDMSVMFDLNYFKYCYLKLTGVEFNEYKLEKDFRQLSADLLSDMNVGDNVEQTFLYRDFQARNVMLKSGRPYYIDFQGGRRGPIYYDVASFLWQASAHYPDELRDRLIDTYLQFLKRYKDMDKNDFMSHLRLFVMFRTLQVLGAYGYRGLWEKKKHFIDSIPSALANLSALINDGVCDPYPYLKEVSIRLINN